MTQLALMRELLGAFSGNEMVLGVVLGLWLWVGFVAIVLASLSLWEGRAWGLFWINAGVRLVNILVMAAIIGMWR